MQKGIVAVLLALNQALLLWLIYSNVGNEDVAEYLGQVEERVIIEQRSTSVSLRDALSSTVASAREHLSHNLVASMLSNFENGVRGGVESATRLKSLAADQKLGSVESGLAALAASVGQVLPTQRREIEKLSVAVSEHVECNEVALKRFENALKLERRERCQNGESGGGAASSGWLLIGMPSVPRRNDVDYLKMTLSRLADDLPRHDADALLGAVHVVVVNNRPGAHRVFEDARRRFELVGDSAFEFADGGGYERWPRAYDELMRGANERKRRGYTRPSPMQQAQTRDVISMLQLVHERYADRYRYFMFMEDDFLVCPHALLALQYAMRKAAANVAGGDGDWTGMRCSFGLNGVVVRMRDLRFLIDYMADGLEVRPPDHLVTEWLAKETPAAAAYFGERRTIAAFKYNLFHHIGRVSSLRKNESPAYPECYEQLGPPTLFDVESWTKKKCPNDDVFPCEPGNKRRLHAPPDGLMPWEQLYKSTRCADDKMAPVALEERPLINTLAAPIDNVAPIRRGRNGNVGGAADGSLANASRSPSKPSARKTSARSSASSSSSSSAMRALAAEFRVEPSPVSASVEALEGELANQLARLSEMRQRVAAQLGADAIRARADKLEADGVVAEQRRYIEQMSASLAEAHQRMRLMQSLVDTAQAQLEASQQAEQTARAEIEAMRDAKARERACPAPPSFDQLSQEARQFIEQQLAEQVDRALAEEARRRQHEQELAEQERFARQKQAEQEAEAAKEEERKQAAALLAVDTEGNIDTAFN
jgi:hypothetical protein